jgi:small subunit ribosomal protein S3Ae
MATKGPKKIQKKKKGGKKKVIDAFAKKEWYVVKIPTYLPKGGAAQFRVGYTPAKKGGARKQLDQRTFEVNLADLSNPPISVGQPVKATHKFQAETKVFKFVTEEVMGKQLLTQWHGMRITRDHRCSLIRKRHTMIECMVDAKTTDGYVLRIKALAFTRRQPDQLKKNCYCKNTQKKAIRLHMREVIRRHVSDTRLEGVVMKLRLGEIGKNIQRRCQLVYPLKNCMVEGVKVIRKPKRDVARMLKLHDLAIEFDTFDEEAERLAEEEAAAEAGEEVDAEMEPATADE